MRISRHVVRALGRGTTVVSCALAAAAGVSLASRSAVAQLVRVEVRDAETGAAVPNALVALQDGAGKAAVERMVSGSGQALLRAPGAGSYRVTVRRIGFAPWTGEAFRVGAADTVAQLLRVPSQRVTLAAVRVRGRSNCADAGDPAVATLWEAVRTAMSTSLAEQGRVPLDAELIERQLNAGGGKVRETRRLAPFAPNRPRPFTAPSAEEIARTGFIVRRAAEGDGDYVGSQRGVSVRETGESFEYFGLDEQLILSPWFVDAHCFEPVRGEGASERGLVGIRFAPARTGANADVAGTIWLDSATAAPHRIDFRYVWRELPPAGRNSGGSVVFAQHPNGAWFVSEWSLRMPRFTRHMETTVLAGYDERGGQARIPPGLAVRTARTPAPRAALVRLAGTVFDSLAGRPLAGATVWHDGGPQRARTDSAGRWTLDSVPAGTVTLRFAHAALDPLALPGLSREVEVGPAGTPAVALATPALPSLRARACGANAPTEGGVVFGEVRDTERGVLVGGAEASIGWTRVDTVAGRLRVRPEVRRATTDRSGAYGICGVPIATELEVRAADAAASSGRATVAVGPLGVRRLDLWVSTEAQALLAAAEAASDSAARARAAAPPAVVGRAQLVGVVRDSTGAPRPGVRVTVDGVPGREATTDADGRFRLERLPGGTHTAVLRAVGYAPQYYPVALRASVADTLEATLRRVITLAGVTITARRAPNEALRAEIARRRALGISRLVDSTVLARAPQFRSALMDVPSLSFGTDGGMAGAWTVLLPRGARRCVARLFIDGRESDWVNARDLWPQEVMAVEVFRTHAQIPARWAGANGGLAPEPMRPPMPSALRAPQGEGASSDDAGGGAPGPAGLGGIEGPAMCGAVMIWTYTAR